MQLVIKKGRKFYCLRKEVIKRIINPFLSSFRITNPEELENTNVEELVFQRNIFNSPTIFKLQRV
jgi:hypothetical protein